MAEPPFGSLSSRARGGERASPVDPTRAARESRVAGPYRLDRVIHERGLLATYRGEHVVTKLVALVRTSAPSVALTDRLRRSLLAEAKLVAKSEGPRVARLLEVDPLGGYFVMEDPRGPSLRQALTRVSNEVPTLAALALVEAMVEAVAVVHARGVVHAGLEPAAFSLTARDAVALGGFERAREKDAEPGERDEERAEGEPAYTAPEVLVGERATPASDVFSLGVIAYEVCAGMHPFTGGRSGRAATPTTESTLVGHRIRNEKAPPIAESRAVPIDVERIIQRALSKQPAHRPESAVELAAELRAVGLDAAREEALRVFAQRVGVGAPVASAAAALDAAPDEGDPGVEVSARPVAIRLGLVFAAMLAVGAGIFSLERGVAERSASESSSSQGAVRVLAHPWAEVWLDGALLDTTPIGRLVQVSAGKHEFVFKHPRATDVRRVVDVAPGARLTVEVTLDIDASPKK